MIAQPETFIAQFPQTIAHPPTFIAQRSLFIAQ
jgi:hypothetical protein